MPQNTFALSSTAPLSKRPCLKDLQFEQHRSKNTKGNDLEAEATSAPSVFILGAQKKKKKQNGSQGHITMRTGVLPWCYQPHARDIGNLSSDVF